MFHNPFFIYDSPITHIEWPPIPNQSTTFALGMLRSLESSQWLPAEQLKQAQFLQLQYLCQQASQFVPYYRDNQYSHFYHTKSINQLMEHWLEVPLLTRKTLQQQFRALQHPALSSEHGKPVALSSSGSTGQPVSVLSDIIVQFFFNALSLRHYHWHQYDFKRKMAVIRDTHHQGTEPPHGGSFESWGEFTRGTFQTSPCYMLQLCDVAEQSAWLKKINPDYLMSYPTVLRELLMSGTPKPSHLKSIITFGEVVDDVLRNELHEQWNIPLIDIYSSTEIGYIALQCPDYDHYHVQDEHVLVEILDENNHPCQPGEVGRVVITALHNLASPLIRYDIGDYAEVGEPCPCGRGLSVIKRVLGRQRNMLTLPDGKKRWPTFTGHSEDNLLSFFKNMQFQVIQKTVYDIEISLVCSSGTLAEQDLIPKLQAIFGYPFHITFNYVAHISRSANGKYEDFKSLVS